MTQAFRESRDGGPSKHRCARQPRENCPGRGGTPRAAEPTSGCSPQPLPPAPPEVALPADFADWPPALRQAVLGLPSEVERYLRCHRMPADRIEEIADEALCELLSTLLPDGQIPAGWADQIRKAADNAWRRNKDHRTRHPTKSLEAAQEAPDQDSPIEEIVRRDLRAAIARVVRSLNSKHQELVYLKFSKNLTHAKIAEHWGCGEKTVDRIWHRAKELLHSSLQRLL